MARGYNKVILAGNVGRDPDYRENDEGTGYTRWSLAVNDGHDTIWVNCIAFGQTAELVARLVRSGQHLLIEGKVQPPRAYKGRDGEYKASLDITVFTFLLLGNKAENDDGYVEYVEVDDFPF